MTIADLRTGGATPYSSAGVRLHRRGRGGRGEPAPGPGGVRAAEFRPQILTDVTDVDPSVTVLGARSAQPFCFAPTGFTRMMQHEGERAVVRVAERVGIPYALSTMGTTSIEDVAAAAPEARKWFQLYVWRDRGAGEDLIARAAGGRLRGADPDRGRAGGGGPAA